MCQSGKSALRCRWALQDCMALLQWPWGSPTRPPCRFFPMANTLLLLQMCAVIVVVGTLRVSGHAPIFNMDPSLFQQLSCHQKFHAMMLPHHNLSVYHLMRSPAGCSGQQRSCT